MERDGERWREMERTYVFSSVPWLELHDHEDDEECHKCVLWRDTKLMI